MADPIETQAQESADACPVVLIVEDEFLLRWAASEFLRESGCRIVEAAHVDDAILAFTGRSGVDLVFSDVNLQGALDGHALSRWVTANHSAVPMLLTSGEKSAAERVTIGATRWFIPKPYALTDVDARIRNILSRGA